MPAINVMALDGIPTAIGAIMDPLGNAFHAALAPDISGSTVLVLGCGPIGCFAVGIARAAGASRVIASVVNPLRLGLAAKMGAQVLLQADADDVVARVRHETGGEGADLVCEMSGHPDALRQALRAVRLGGRVHLLGIPHGEVALNLANDVIFKGVTIYGVVGRKTFETWHQMRSFLASGLLDPTPVVTHRFPLPEIDRALDSIRSGAAGKVILEIGSD